MPAVRWPALAFVLLILTGSGTVPGTGEPGAPAPLVVRLGTFDFPPFAQQDESGRISGYFTKFLGLLEERNELRFELQHYQTSSALIEALASGEVDAGPLSRFEGSDAIADFTAPFATLTVAIFGSPSAPDSVEVEELAGKRVAVISESFVERAAPAVLAHVRFLPARDEARAFTALASGEVDYILMDLARALHAIERLRLPGIRTVGYVPLQREVSFAVAKDKPAIFTALEQASTALPAEEVKRLRQEWLSAYDAPWSRAPSSRTWLPVANLALVIAALAAAVVFPILARRRVRLRRAQRLLRQVSRTALVGGWEYDVLRNRISWSLELHEIHGSDPASFRPTTRRCLQLVDRVSVAVLKNAFAACIRQGKPFNEIVKLRTVSGATLWASISGDAEARNGRVTRIIGALRNIDDFKRQTLALAQTQRLYRALAHGTSDLVTVCDQHGVVQYASPSARALIGYTPSELIGTKVERLFAAPNPVDLFGLHRRVVESKEIETGTCGLVCKNGTQRWFEYRAHLMEGEEPDGELLLTARDITGELKTEERVRHLAMHDALTGFPNRLAFGERLSRLIGPAAENGASVAVCFLDIDDFRIINDTRGHVLGDRVLKELAGRITRSRAGRHFAGRFGGDEFAILIHAPDAANEAEHVARDLIDAFSESLDALDHSLSVSASIGIAVFPDDAGTHDELLAAADLAVDAAKAAGKGAFRRYESDIGKAFLAKAKALEDVRGAFRRNELELFYQPKFKLDSGRLSGVEALLRWRTPQGYRGPAEMIQAAEASGFIKTLGYWMLETAANQAIEWVRDGIECPIAVNVSALQLHDRDFLDHLKSVIARDPRLTGRLEIEITETAIAIDTVVTKELLAEIRNLGVRVHVDDFGSGYSSLAYLGELPVDTLKIDRSLVIAAPFQRKSQEIMRSIVALAKTLGLGTIAEGVETPAHAELMKELGCSEAQGYLYCRAVPADELVRRLLAGDFRDREPSALAA